MKTNSLLLVFAFIANSAMNLLATESTASTAVASKVGTYDSRALAFAHFWSTPCQSERATLVNKAKAAEQSGDAVLLEQTRAHLNALARASHLQVFSTAPATEALAALKDKLPLIEQELGVACIVSKWDDETLKSVPKDKRIEITDRLVREFSPDERRKKTLEAMRTTTPIPLEKAKRLLAEGKM